MKDAETIRDVLRGLPTLLEAMRKTGASRIVIGDIVVEMGGDVASGTGSDYYEIPTVLPPRQTGTEKHRSANPLDDPDLYPDGQVPVLEDADARESGSA